MTAPPRSPRARPRAKIAGRISLLGLLALAGSMGGCFSLQQPACAFSCAEPPNRCPGGYSCGADQLCHRSDGGQVGAGCPSTPTPTPTPPGDASVDAADTALD